MPPPPRRGHYAMMLSDVCLSVAYIGPKSRTERPAKNKIGTEVSHVTRDSDTTFKVKRSKGQGHRGGRGHIVAAPHSLLVSEVRTYSGMLRSSVCYG